MNESCWIPTQKPKPDGYIQISTKSGKKYLHRLVFETFVKKINKDKFLDHLCRERSCCNPYHLEPVTNHENIKRGNTGLYQKIKTHCPKKHKYSIENTYYYKNMRFCRLCRNINQQKYMKRKNNG